MPDREIPEFRAISPTMRVDLFISDWRAELLPEWSAEEKERRLYDRAWEAYQEGDYGFGLWCWHECDRLTIALGGNLREANRILGADHYFGFSHRKAVAERVPFEKIYRPRKGDMSTPRTDAYVLPHYQALCVHALRAASGDAIAKAHYEIALGELELLRRADPYLRFFDTFRDLLQRTSATAAPSIGGGGAPPTPEEASAATTPKRRSRPTPTAKPKKRA